MSATLIREARQFLFASRDAVLSTHSMKYPGYPFAASLQMVCNQQAEPLLLLNTSAEHTRNLQDNPRVSLLIAATHEQPQTGASLTLLGEALPADKQDSDLRARYLRYFPQAQVYFDLADFHFYRIRIDHARYIAGPAHLGWFEGDTFNEQMVNSMLAAQEAGIVSHMNEDHKDSLLEYCRHVHGVAADHAEMTGLDMEGFDVSHLQGEEVQSSLRFQFEQPVFNAMDARKALVALAQACRA